MKMSHAVLGLCLAAVIAGVINVSEEVVVDEVVEVEGKQSRGDQVDWSVYGVHHDIYTTMMSMCRERSIDPNEAYAIYCPECKSQRGHKTPVESPLQLFNVSWGNGWIGCRLCKHPFGRDWKITRHVKFYYAGGVGLSCGNRIVLYSPHSEFYNWIVEKCRFCGMEVHTAGIDKYEDRVFEIQKSEGMITGADLIKAVRQ